VRTAQHVLLLLSFRWLLDCAVLIVFCLRLLTLLSIGLHCLGRTASTSKHGSFSLSASAELNGHNSTHHRRYFCVTQTQSRRPPGKTVGDACMGLSVLRFPSVICTKYTIKPLYAYYRTTVLKTKSLTVTLVGRLYRLLSKTSVRFLAAKKNDFPEWLQSHTRYGDAAISNTTINSR